MSLIYIKFIDYESVLKSFRPNQEEDDLTLDEFML